MEGKSREIASIEASLREDIRKIDSLIERLGPLSTWIQSTFVVYDRYKEALEHPQQGRIGKEKKLLLEQFPKYKLSFREGEALLEPRLEEEFIRYCEKRNLSIRLPEFVALLNDFVEQKGTGKIGAFKLFDMLNQIMLHLQAFKKYLLLPADKRASLKRESTSFNTALKASTARPGQRLTRQEKRKLRNPRQP